MYLRLIVLIVIHLVGYLEVTGQNLVYLDENNIYKLQDEHLELAIDGNIGARVVSFKIDGSEILGSIELHPRSYGSTFWLSPQGKWGSNKILNASAYTLESREEQSIILKSGNDSLNGFRVSKNFQLNPSDSSVTIKYTVTNIANKNQEVAPWEVSRVPMGGLTFFPKGSPKDEPTGHRGLPYLKIKDSLGIIWYPYDSTMSSREKLFMNGSEGWLAYVRNGMVFIKKFPTINPLQAAPGEKNVEIFGNKENGFLELENQGIYEILAPGDSLSYDVKWYARWLPKGMKPEIGNRNLVKYIRKVIL